MTSSPAGIDCGSSCSASIGGGAVVQLTPYPADGYEFLYWTGTGCTTGTVTMSGARTCTAVFQVAPCDPGGCRQAECEGSGGRWDDETCSCQPLWEDPLVLTLDGQPIHLTDAAGGVGFDLGGSGIRTPVAWTQAGSTAAFLVLDLDGDGLITTGAELFGMSVGAPRHQKPSASDNSFTLLAAYDDPARGGNGDGLISAADAVFSRLRLWVDTNHDGVSQPGELMPLAAAGVVSIELTYRTTGRRDGHGNFFRYRGAVHLTSGRTVAIWDVFLVTGPATGATTPAADGAARQGDDAEWVAIEADAEAMALSAWTEVVSSAALPDPPPTPLQVVEYYHLDALGSVRAVTDAQGQVIARHDFLPFGDELSPQYPPHDRKLFTGQERDFETGLGYLRARQLRVDLGRFTTPDPLTDLAWTDPRLGATNAYGYVQSNPLGFIDPMGAQGQSDDNKDKAGTMWCDDKGCIWIPGPSVTVTPNVQTLPPGNTTGTTGRGGQTGKQVPGGGNAGNDGLQQQIDQLQQQVNLLLKKPLNTCDQMEKQGTILGGVGVGAEVVALGLDAGGVTLPAGVSVHVFGAAAVITGGIWGGVGAIGNYFGVCK